MRFLLRPFALEIFLADRSNALFSFPSAQVHLQHFVLNLFGTDLDIPYTKWGLNFKVICIRWVKLIIRLENRLLFFFFGTSVERRQALQ